jgi:iron(III) transport system ATP-binding protein
VSGGRAGPAREPAGLEVTGLHKSFGDNAVLVGVDLAVDPGSFAAILGPSGSGKTTLLRLLAGFDRPDAGRVRIGGRTVDDGGTHVRSEDRRIGYVPQEGGLFPHLTVAANIGFGLPRPERRRALDGLVDLVGLGGLTDRYPHQLSGGQQQRVALARALAIGPDVVLLDEPFSSLDASLRASVRDDVRRVLTEAGTTALLVTHDQDEALSLADAVAVMRAGRIVQQGSPAELYARPVDPALARFVGDGNLVAGVAAAGCVTSCFGALPLLPEVASGFADGQKAIVLVRPEQLTLDAGPGGTGVAGRVVRTAFHGHDTIVTVRSEAVADSGPAGEPQGAGATGSFRVRLATAATIATGAEVTLTARGEVMAWPA